MPKELTHWYIAEEAARRLPSGEVRDLLTGPLRSDYLLGAVSPDTLFYGPADPHARAAADRAHGTSGENTYAFLTRALRLDPTDADFAFLCGILAHIAADAAFHPVVYYFCGTDRDAPGATARHWAFETRLDLYVMQKTGYRRYRDMMRGAHFGRRRLLELLGAYFSQDGPAARRILRRSIARFSLIQGLFKSRFVAAVAGAVGALAPAKRRVLGLSYAAQRMTPWQLFALPFSYRHPVLGDSESTSFEELVDRAVGRLVPLLSELREAIRLPEAADRVRRVSGWTGPSLETGIEFTGDAAPFDMKHARPDLFDAFFDTALQDRRFLSGDP